MTQTASKLTDAQKAQALANVYRNIESRRALAAKGILKGFAKEGNAKCLSRAIGTARDMENGVASDAQYRAYL